MATGMVLSVAQTLFAALQCKELRELYSMFEYESQLHELEHTVTTIKAVLLDAESKQQELTHQGQDWVESLKDAVYDVDDLVDEFRTMAQQGQQMRNAKISKKVRRFFSRANKLLVAFKTSHEIKKLIKQLDSISKTRGNFGFGETYEPSIKREETTSFVCEGSIIGRETDKEAIVSMLLHESEDNISFVSIVGIGGLGKTTLAQLVFNDDRIKSEYDLRMWVFVSPDYSMEKILSDMLEKDGLKKEALQREVHQKIKGNKYLLVLDDVWNESRNEWVDLRNFLKFGGKGSRVLVTSRSKKVASVIENNLMYELQGLSEGNSWSLFKRMAFEHGNEPADSRIVEIGKEIVKRCANVPLCIRVIGSLLYGQVESKWLSFDLSNMGRKEGVMPILKFSYYNLSTSLKSCFSYCALFPKGYVIKKQFLINLWAAQGCLDGPQEGQNIEDVGEEYFSTLLQRCFLQDIEKDEYDEISSCKMHDLIHDLAQDVAGKEINTKIRHIPIADKSLDDLFAQSDSLNKMENLRTILLTYAGRMRDPDVAKLIANCRRLRVLKLNFLGVNVYPNTFSHLVHLRYLELSYNDELEILPKSTTKLLNLQVLNLKHCSKLKELPKDLGKLVNLRQLDITGCVSMTHMPAGFNRLTCLHTLTMFVLGKGSSNQVEIGQLENLKHLTNLRGELEIVVKQGYLYHESKVEGKYLVNKPHVKALTIKGENEYCRPEVIIDEQLLEGLEPHCKVKGLDIRGYEGLCLPYWALRMESSLPWLVNLVLENFPGLIFLSSLSELQHLKFLKLWNMASVRYMRIDSKTAKFTYFWSLETLVMYHLPNFDGWRTYTTRGYVIPPFPCLQILQIVDCPSLKSFPQCPHLKTAKLMEFNQHLEFSEKTVAKPGIVPKSSFFKPAIDNDNSSREAVVDMEELTIDDVEMLKSLSVQVKRFLHIRRSKIESLSDAGIERVTTDLRHFQISHCQNLVLEDEADGMMPWKALHTLTRLDLSMLPKMVNLPKGFQYLTSLHTLIIEECDNLEGLPEWLDSLTSLQLIVIKSCPKFKSLPEAISRLPFLTELEILKCDDDLRERCKEPDGEDWPKIRHIPSLLLSSDQV